MWCVAVVTWLLLGGPISGPETVPVPLLHPGGAAKLILLGVTWQRGIKLGPDPTRANPGFSLG